MLSIVYLQGTKLKFFGFIGIFAFIAERLSFYLFFSRMVLIELMPLHK